MAEIVGIYAASHTPVMLNFPQAIPDDDRETIFAAFKALGRRMHDADPQAILVISDDHLHNFFLNNLPAFCIGAADAYPTPVEHWLKAEKRILPGDGALGAYLLGAALEAGFDPAFSMDMTLDHGALTPLELAGIGRDVPLVPIMINCVQPPFPTMRRCVQWGRFLARALEAYQGIDRVAILATGGISHDVGTPRMGLINEEFDRTFLELLAAGDDEALIRHATDCVGTAGNGAEEIRTWLMAYGAAGPARYEPIFYKAVHKWYTGIGLGEWRRSA